MKKKIVLYFCLLVLSNSLIAVESSNTNAAANLSTRITTNRIIVKYRANTLNANSMSTAATMLNNVVTVNGVSIKHHHDIGNAAQVWELNKMLPSSDVEAITNKIALDPTVEYAEPDLILEPQFTPNDSRYNEQWNYFDATAGINLPLAWDNVTGQGVVVAVIDTGYLSHADLVSNILPGYDMISDIAVANDGGGRDADAHDPGDAVSAGECSATNLARSSTWHGTHVAGIVAAITNNNIGIAGVAFNAKVVPVRVMGKCGGYTSDVADGIIWASGGSVVGTPVNANPANVINLSLGNSGTCSTTMQTAINLATTSGATVVIASGNSAQDASNFTPANCNNVISVAAVNRSGGRAYYSNFGTSVDIAAPGGDTQAVGPSGGILSTLNDGTTAPGNDNYIFYQGTSMAAPHVAGLAALIYSARATITPSEVKSIIINSAQAFPALCSGCGAGIIDAASAVNAVLNGGGQTNNTGSLKNNIAMKNLSGAKNSEQFFTLVVPSGAKNLKFVITGSGDADIYVKYGTKPSISSYDYRPFTLGSNETVNVTAIQSGTYNVMIRGYSAYSAVSLTGSYSVAGSGGATSGQTFTNNTKMNIVDLSTTTSVINVNQPVNLGTITVKVDITHSYIGDLTIDLIDPSGNIVNLKAGGSGGATANYVQTHIVNVAANNTGNWSLRVTDNAQLDTGSINQWSITIP